MAEPQEGVPGGSYLRWQEGLRWFLPEFLVIVVGVLVALGIDAWWDERADREREAAYLDQLAADLSTTEVDLEGALDGFMTRALAAAQFARAYWQQPRPTMDELAPAIRELATSRRYRPVLGTIHALISTGDLTLIESLDMRARLVAYSEWAQARIDDIERFDATYFRPAVSTLSARINMPELVAPLVRAESTASEPLANDIPGQPAPFPNDIEALLADRALYQAAYQMAVTHRNQAYQYRLLLDEARALHGEITRLRTGDVDAGNCQLHVVEGTVAQDAPTYAGSCGAVLGAGSVLELRLQQATSLAGGRGMAAPDLLASGTARDASGRETPVELEVDIRRNGALRTEWGWIPLRALATRERSAYTPGALSPTAVLSASSVQARITPKTVRVSFRLSPGAMVPPDALDAAILRRARELLADESVWDRADDRDCEPADTRFSLYCALHRASLEEAGGFHHRRPALEAVRAVVDKRSAGRSYEHRLREWNNDPRTTLADIHAVIDEALAGIEVAAH